MSFCVCRRIVSFDRWICSYFKLVAVERLIFLFLVHIFFLVFVDGLHHIVNWERRQWLNIKLAENVNVRVRTEFFFRRQNCSVRQWIVNIDCHFYPREKKFVHLLDSLDLFIEKVHVKLKLLKTENALNVSFYLELSWWFVLKNQYHIISLYKYR